MKLMSIINALGNVAIASGNLIHFSNGQLLLNSHSYSQNILFFFGRKLFQDEQKLRNQINGLKKSPIIRGRRLDVDIQEMVGQPLQQDSTDFKNIIFDVTSEIFQHLDGIKESAIQCLFSNIVRSSQTNITSGILSSLQDIFPSLDDPSPKPQLTSTAFPTISPLSVLIDTLSIHPSSKQSFEPSISSVIASTAPSMTSSVPFFELDSKQNALDVNNISLITLNDEGPDILKEKTMPKMYGFGMIIGAICFMIVVLALWTIRRKRDDENHYYNRWVESSSSNIALFRDDDTNEEEDWVTGYNKNSDPLPNLHFDEHLARNVTNYNEPNGSISSPHSSDSERQNFKSFEHPSFDDVWSDYEGYI